MKRRTVIAGALVGALVLGGAGVAMGMAPGLQSLTPAPSKPARDVSISTADMTSTLAGLSKRLSCTSRIDIFADRSFFDPAVGTTCFHGDGSVSFIRVYQHASTVARVLEEWAPTLGEGRLWSRGTHWVFMGTRSDAKRLGRSGNGSPPTASPPPSVGTPQLEAARDTCISFLFATAFDRVVGASSYSATIRELDAQYPGARRAVENTVSSGVRQQLAHRDDDDISASLTRFAAPYREVCRDAR